MAIAKNFWIIKINTKIEEKLYKMYIVVIETD